MRLVTRASVEGNLWVAQQVLPQLAGLRVLRAWAAMYVDFDGAPIIGSVPGLPGFKGRMIVIENVSKRYGSFEVLRGCTTSVRKGEVVVICGRSGSGKSTLIKCVNGLEPFDTGRIAVNGQEVGASSTDLSALRRRIGMTSHDHA